MGYNYISNLKSQFSKRKYFEIDNSSSLPDPEKVEMSPGSECLDLTLNTVYILNTKNAWILVPNRNPRKIGDLS